MQITTQIDVVTKLVPFTIIQQVDSYANYLVRSFLQC